MIYYSFTVCIVLFLLFVWLKYKTGSRTVPLPPGPPADPLIGHLRIIPPETKELTFYEWSQAYGDVMYLHGLGKSIVVLSSVQAAVDLLEKRSAFYSDRPDILIYELMEMGPNLVLLHYGQQWRKHRKMLHTYLMEKACPAFRPIQTQNAHILLKGLMENKANYESHLIRYTTSIIIRIAFGHQILSDDDEYLKMTEDLTAVLEAAGPPGSSVVDLFPWLRHFPSWFPGTHYANVARAGTPAIRRLFDVPFENVKKEMAEGTHETSFLASHLEASTNWDTPPTEDDVEDIKGAAGVMYAAGAETTMSTLLTFLLIMLHYPECQKKAWEEINRVTKGERLPDFDDKMNLPYVEGLVQEVLRWYPVVPIGVPHRSMKDDIYRGMFIPKGSMIVTNVLAMSRDENTYTNPTVFNPSRYLPESEGGNNEPFLGAVFGFGRRICPGRHLGYASVWIAIVSILATMEISAPRDEHGQDVLPDISFISGATSHPKPFKCHFKPRGKKAEELIMQAIQTVC